MNELKTLIQSDTWIEATWNEYLQVLDELDDEKNKGYYFNNHYRIERPPIGNDHASDHNIVMYAVNLYGTINNIDFTGKDACSYRKMGYREAQPDVSYYIGQKASIIPYGTSIIDLDRYRAPDLVIEISKSTLADDLGNKRLLYEELGVSEYWIVDVQNLRIIAFKIVAQGSHRITRSEVFAGLEIAILNEALQRTRQSNHSVVGQWLMQKFTR
jgi:Uma2 family endonuclease